MSEKEQLLKDTLGYVQNDFVGSQRGEYIYHRLINPDDNVFAIVLLPNKTFGYITPEGYLGKIEKAAEYGPPRTIYVDGYDNTKVKPFDNTTPIPVLVSIINKLTNSMYSFNKNLKFNE